MPRPPLHRQFAGGFERAKDAADVPDTEPRAGGDVFLAWPTPPLVIRTVRQRQQHEARRSAWARAAEDGTERNV